MRYKHFASTSAVMVAAGCTTMGGTSAFQPEPGATMEVTKQLDFPRGSTHLYIQDGVPLQHRDVNRFVAFCRVNLDRKRDGQPLVDSVQPGIFTTGKTKLSVRVSDAGPRKPVQMTSSDGSVPLQLAQGGAPSPTIFLYDTIISLHSDDQPQVANLTCSYDGGPVGNHLSPAEIRDALGELVRFY